MGLQAQANGTYAGSRPDEMVVEAMLVLSGTQLRRLEQAALRRGLTAGQMLRMLVRDFLERDGLAVDGLAVPEFRDENSAPGQWVEVYAKKNA